MPKTRLNISTDKDLADFIKTYAAENRTTIANIVTQYILSLKRRTEGKETNEILSNPIFNESMIEVQTKLQEGTSTWHSYHDVFGD
ncbi:MAG: DUF6364 family protein [Desulfobacula sp.]|nr:DUF6364 family protein [Desulfobacula sp.]